MAYQGLISSGASFTLFANGVEIPRDATGELSWDGDDLVAAQFSEASWQLYFDRPRSVRVTINSYLSVTDNGADPAEITSSPSTWISPWQQVNTTTFTFTQGTADPVQFIQFYVGNAGVNLTDHNITIEIDLDDDAQSVSYNCNCETTVETKTLAQMREALAVNLGYADQLANLGAGTILQLNNWLDQAQRLVWSEYDEFRNERFYRWEMSQGVRFYDFDENVDSCTKPMSPEKITGVWVQVDNEWLPVAYGINPGFYTDPENEGIPCRYQIANCIEVWPAPDDDDQILRVRGNFGLSRFTQDADVTTVDWLAVLYRATFLGKAHKGQPDANAYLGMEMDRVGSLVSSSHQTARYVPGEEEEIPMPRPIFLPLVTP